MNSSPASDLHRSPQALHLLKVEAMEEIHIALVKEAKKRSGRSFEEWSRAEADVVWQSACSIARRNGLASPVLSEVVRVERLACGHVDYGQKWALYVAEIMVTARPQVTTLPAPVQ